MENNAETMRKLTIARRVTPDEFRERCAGKIEYFEGKIMVAGTELFVAAEDPEVIAARRLTIYEFHKYTEKLEFYRGAVRTGPGIELFVGIEQFEEATKKADREWQEEREERKRLLGQGDDR